MIDFETNPFENVVEMVHSRAAEVVESVADFGHVATILYPEFRLESQNNEVGALGTSAIEATMAENVHPTPESIATPEATVTSLADYKEQRNPEVQHLKSADPQVTSEHSQQPTIAPVTELSAYEVQKRLKNQARLDAAEAGEQTMPIDLRNVS